VAVAVLEGAARAEDEQVDFGVDDNGYVVGGGGDLDAGDVVVVGLGVDVGVGEFFGGGGVELDGLAVGGTEGGFVDAGGAGGCCSVGDAGDAAPCGPDAGSFDADAEAEDQDHEREAEHPERDLAPVVAPRAASGVAGHWGKLRYWSTCSVWLAVRWKPPIPPRRGMAAAGTLTVTWAVTVPPRVRSPSSSRVRSAGLRW
jgi:hypothetical protein